MDNHRAIGLGIMFAAVFFFFVGFLYIRSAEWALLSGHELGEGGECIHPTGTVCPYEQLNQLAIPKYLGLFADLILFSYGIWLYVKRKPEEKALDHARQQAKELGGEEALVFDHLIQANGLVFQHDLVQKTGMSKVKITRILDRLETKGLIERRRRGMTNLIVVK